jgi:hypothetical protein
MRRRRFGDSGSRFGFRAPGRRFGGDRAAATQGSALGALGRRRTEGGADGQVRLVAAHIKGRLEAAHSRGGCLL